MQKDIPTLSLEQYESILQLDLQRTVEDQLVINPPIYPDKLSSFLKNYLNEINDIPGNKIL